jgi:hypothetical protein
VLEDDELVVVEAGVRVYSQISDLSLVLGLAVLLSLVLLIFEMLPFVPEVAGYTSQLRGWLVWELFVLVVVLVPLCMLDTIQVVLSSQSRF